MPIFPTNCQFYLQSANFPAKCQFVRLRANSPDFCQFSVAKCQCSRPCSNSLRADNFASILEQPLTWCDQLVGSKRFLSALTKVRKTSGFMDIYTFLHNTHCSVRGTRISACVLGRVYTSCSSASICVCWLYALFFNIEPTTMFSELSSRSLNGWAFQPTPPPSCYTV